MQSKALTVEDYLLELPEDRITPMTQLRKTIKKNLPAGFKEVMSYGMIGYIVPHALYASGYHTDPKKPLPFINIASQKNFIALYHMGLYSDTSMLQWFQDEYKKANVGKLDMGKSCIRFHHADKIPYTLIGDLVSKIKPEQWIAQYEALKPIKK